MARPREFDENEVLDRALQVFWTRGFEATSIQDLVVATGIGRASLYGAFGDKEQLFDRALVHYLAQAEDLGKLLLAEPSPRRVLEKFCTAWVTTVCPKRGPRGCFLLLAGTTCNEETPAVRTKLRESIARTERSLEDLVRRGQEQGEFSRHQEPKELARWLVVLLQGIAVAARAGRSAEQLQAVTRTALAFLGQP